MINETWKQIKKYQGGLKIERIPKTSVLSPIFPGQFNYCLDERHFLEKYGNLIDIEEEHFQKMMPVVRLADFDENILDNGMWKSTYHLSCFSMTTISDGHVVKKTDGNLVYSKSVGGIIDFLCNCIGLDKKRIFVSYFDGTANLSQIEASRKKILKPDFRSRILSNYIPPADVHAAEYFAQHGIPLENIFPSNTRDCFLTTNWDVAKAPMGYRNELYYKLKNGHLLDIATIENLVIEPIIEIKEGMKYVVDVKPWDMNFVINGLGIERLIVAKNDLSSIFSIPEFACMLKLGATEGEIEAVRILHRVFTDSGGDYIQSASRRSKIKHLLKFINSLPLGTILEILRLNSVAYSKIFPELKDSIPYVMQVITKYKISKPQ